MAEVKIILVGTKKVGKGALAIRFSHGYFMENYDPTVEDSYRKRLNVQDKECLVELQKVSDYEPSEGFSNGQQIRDAQGFVLVYSVTDSASFDTINKSKQNIEKIKGTGFIPMALCGSKTDVAASERKVTSEQGQQLGQQLGVPFFEASAQAGSGVEEMFNSLVNLVLNGAPKAAPAAANGGGGGNTKAAKKTQEKKRSACTLL